MKGVKEISTPSSEIAWETIVLAALAALRFLLPFAPDRLFDVDPATVAGPFPAVGPSGAAFFDVVILLVAAVALWRESRRGGLDPWIVGLGLVPLPILVLHGSGDLLDAWRGADWFAAVMLGVALAHLVRSPPNRRIVISVVLGAIAAGGVRGFHQVFWEHAETVAFFESNRDLILSSRGWAEGSPAALAFERRLLQPEATGWIGFSNVFSGLSGAAAVALAGIVFARCRRVTSPSDNNPTDGAGGPVVVGLAAISLAMLVGINGSKGAIGATLLGVVVLAAAFGPGREMLRRRPMLPVLGAVVFMAALVVGRGMLGDDFAGERSLLFRWHYLLGAMGMLESSAMVGVGPDGFQAAYVTNKPATSPENVASAHSMGVDWIASLGVLGAAWLVVAILVCSRASNPVPENDRGARIGVMPLAAVLVCIVGCIAYEQVRTEWPLDEVSIGIRVAALACGSIVAWSVWGSTERLEPEAVRSVGLSAAVVVIAHAQIEMIFWQPAAMSMAWAFLAAGGDAKPGGFVRGRIIGGVVAASLLGVAILVAASSVRARLAESRAATVIEPLHADFIEDRMPDGAERLVASRALVALVEENGWFDPRPVRGAIDQFLIVGTPEALAEGAEIADRWFDARPGPESAGIRSSVWLAATGPGAEDSVLAATLAVVEDAIGFDPTEPRLELARGELLAAMGRRNDAMAALYRVESLDEARGLDPLQKLGDVDRRRLENLRGSIDPSGS